LYNRTKEVKSEESKLVLNQTIYKSLIKFSSGVRYVRNLAFSPSDLVGTLSNGPSTIGAEAPVRPMLPKENVTSAHVIHDQMTCLFDLQFRVDWLRSLSTRIAVCLLFSFSCSWVNG
jgi:hypothetical protein